MANSATTRRRDLLLIASSALFGALAAILLTATAQNLPNPIQPADEPVRDSGVLGRSDFVYLKLRDGTRCISPRGGGAISCQWPAARGTK